MLPLDSAAFLQSPNRFEQAPDGLATKFAVQLYLYLLRRQLSPQQVSERQVPSVFDHTSMRALEPSQKTLLEPKPKFL